MMLRPFFAPRGVVVIGASQDPAKLGHGLARNLVASGYAGGIHFVNPGGGRLFEREMYTDVALVPDPVDLAVIATPPRGASQVLRACHARGITAAIVASGGFRETGPEGAALERDLVETARSLGIALMGPNCLGILDTHLPIDTTFLPPPAPKPGPIALVSHSGAICAAVADWANGRGVGLSRMVSLGNQAALTESDLLAPVADDPQTRVIALYLEGVADGRRFVREAAAVSRRTPLVALKVGRTAAGMRAAASHTGALAGDDAAFDAACHRAGVLRATTMAELLGWSRALAWCPLPAGRRVAILTNAGGPGVVGADAVAREGLVMAELAAGTTEALRALLPPAASVANPVDMLAGATPEQYAACLEQLLEDDGVDAVMVVLPPPPMVPAEAFAAALVPPIVSASKPVVVAVLGGQLIGAAARRLAEGCVVEYRFAEQAASALAALARRAEWLARPALADAPLLEPGHLREIVRGARGWLTPEVGAALLTATGVTQPPMTVAPNADEAAKQASAIGFPVVLKVSGPDLTHKSDVGGVALDVRDADAVREAARSILARVREVRPEAMVSGIMVQRQAPAGEDLIVGCVRDPQFGAIAMVGGGGVQVEEMRDVTFALAPLDAAEANRMLDATRAGRRLRGFRGSAPADRAAAVDALVALSLLAATLPEIAEIEINPLRVYRAGKGAEALDVRVRVEARLALA